MRDSKGAGEGRSRPRFSRHAIAMYPFAIIYHLCVRWYMDGRPAGKQASHWRINHALPLHSGTLSSPLVYQLAHKECLSLFTLTSYALLILVFHFRIVSLSCGLNVHGRIASNLCPLSPLFFRTLSDDPHYSRSSPVDRLNAGAAAAAANSIMRTSSPIYVQR